MDLTPGAVIEEIDHFGGCHCGAIKFKVVAPKCPVIIHCK